MPSIDESELYDKYDFSEPWNGPNNSKLANQMPAAFACPSQQVVDIGTTTSTTSYLALVGPNAAFKPGTSHKLSDFSDGTDRTIIVVEVAGSDVHWMEPRDIRITNGHFPIGSPHTVNTGIWSQSVGVYALNVDGSLRFLPSDTAQDILKALTTIDGNEPIPEGF